MSDEKKQKMGKAVRVVTRLAFAMVFGVVLPLLIIGAAAYKAKEFMDTAPKAERRGPSGDEMQARLVEVQQAEARTHQVNVGVMGTVAPSRRVTVQPQVSGRVVSMHPSLVRGGIVRQGDELVTI